MVSSMEEIRLPSMQEKAEMAKVDDSPSRPGGDRTSSIDLPTPIHEKSTPTPPAQIDPENPDRLYDGSSLHQQETLESMVQPPPTLWAESIFIAIICMAQLLTQAGLGQTLAPLHIIGDSLGIDDPGELSWLLAAYSLTVGTFILVAGRLGDLYGHKRMFVLGFIWYALWSVLAGFAVYANSIFFNCCRAFQGMGPAFVLPNGVAIIGMAYPPGKRKAMIFGIFGAMAPTGFVMGAVFASIFAKWVWWPWAFWVMGIVCLLVATAAAMVIPRESTMPLRKDVSVFHQIDVWGAATGITGLILVNFAWNQAPIVGWQDPYTYILLIVGISSLGIFGYIERHARFPLVPFRALNLEIVIVLVCVMLGWSSFGIWLLYMYQFLEILRGLTPLQATAQTVPVVFTGLIAALLSGWALPRIAGSWIMMGALGSFLTGSILLATAPVQQTYWAQIFVSFLIMPFGMDMSFPAANLLLSNLMPREHQGVSASLVNTLINYSISLALGFAGTIEVQVQRGGSGNGGGSGIGAGIGAKDADLLRGYRGALYFAVATSGAGFAIAVVFALAQRWRWKGRGGDGQPEKRRRRSDGEVEAGPTGGGGAG